MLDLKDGGVPSNTNIAKCIITKETVLNNKEPDIVIDENKTREQVKIEKNSC